MDTKNPDEYPGVYIIFSIAVVIMTGPSGEYTREGKDQFNSVIFFTLLYRFRIDVSRVRKGT